MILAADVCEITAKQGRKLVENGTGDFSLDVQRARGVADRMKKFHALVQTKDLEKVQKQLAVALSRLAQAITIIDGAGLEEFREVERYLTGMEGMLEKIVSTQQEIEEGEKAVAVAGGGTAAKTKDSDKPDGGTAMPLGTEGATADSIVKKSRFAMQLKASLKMGAMVKNLVSQKAMAIANKSRTDDDPEKMVALPPVYTQPPKLSAEKQREKNLRDCDITTGAIHQHMQSLAAGDVDAAWAHYSLGLVHEFKGMDAVAITHLQKASGMLGGGLDAGSGGDPLCLFHIGSIKQQSDEPTVRDPRSALDTLILSEKAWSDRIQKNGGKVPACDDDVFLRHQLECELGDLLLRPSAGGGALPHCQGGGELHRQWTKQMQQQPEKLFGQTLDAHPHFREVHSTLGRYMLDQKDPAEPGSGNEKCVKHLKELGGSNKCTTSEHKSILGVSQWQPTDSNMKWVQAL
jgi:hypothetical protein